MFWATLVSHAELLFGALLRQKETYYHLPSLPFLKMDSKNGGKVIQHVGLLLCILVLELIFSSFQLSAVWERMFCSNF